MCFPKNLFHYIKKVNIKNTIMLIMAKILVEVFFSPHFSHPGLGEVMNEFNEF